MQTISGNNLSKLIPSLRRGDRKAIYLGSGEIMKIFEEHGREVLEEFCFLADVTTSPAGAKYLSDFGINVGVMERKVGYIGIVLRYADGTKSEAIRTKEWDRVGQTLRIKGVDDDIQHVSLSGVVSIVENKTIYYTL
jgi:hypothetical protein